jgi:hypothetical protein
MRWWGVDSWTPVTIRMRGAPNPIPARPDKMMALVESSGWIVAKPAIPAVKIKKPAKRGSLIVLKWVLNQPQVNVVTIQQIQYGCERAASRKGSDSKRPVVLSRQVRWLIVK